MTLSIKSSTSEFPFIVWKSPSHFAIDVKDVDYAFEALKQAGFEILAKEPTFLAFWKNGTRFFNVKGPNGEIIEFNQIL